MRTGITVEVSAADHERLAVIAAERNSPQKHFWRVRIVLLTAVIGRAAAAFLLNRRRRLFC